MARSAFAKRTWYEPSALSAFGVADSHLFVFGVPHENDFPRIPPHQTRKGFGASRESEFPGNLTSRHSPTHEQASLAPIPRT
jgi:hypothetical protein